MGPMNQRTRFLGLDVHKETIAVAIAEEGSEPWVALLRPRPPPGGLFGAPFSAVLDGLSSAGTGHRTLITDLLIEVHDLVHQRPEALIVPDLLLDLLQRGGGDGLGHRLTGHRLGQQMQRAMPWVPRLRASAMGLATGSVNTVDAALTEIPHADQLLMEPGPLLLEPSQIVVFDVRHERPPSECDPAFRLAQSRSHRQDPPTSMSHTQ